MEKFENQVLDAMFLSFVSEADAEIASLANDLNCPVLSNDSDFFIFDIRGGFIPLSSFNWKIRPLKSDIFYRTKLAHHFRIRPELLPLLASLAGNDYVSLKLLEPLHERQMGPFRRNRTSFPSISKLLSRAPTSERGALEYVLQYVCWNESRDQLIQAVKYSLQEYTIRETSLVRYFQHAQHARVVFSSLRAQNGHEINDWVLKRFRKGLFSTNCMSSLTAGKVFLGVQVENCREISANRCSQFLRKLMYGILNNATPNERRRNITMVQEWDRVESTVKPSNVAPVRDGNVPRLSSVPNLNLKNRLTVFFDALDSNTANIKSSPEEFKLIAASLRFLVSNAQPPLKTNHLAALLCSCVKLADGSWKQYLENPRRSLSQTFGEQAAQSFCQWQCVLRDAIHLNFVLFEPVQTPCIHKTFNGRLVHCLQEELNQGKYLPGNKTFLMLTAVEKLQESSISLLWSAWQKLSSFLNVVPTCVHKEMHPFP